MHKMLKKGNKNMGNVRVIEIKESVFADNDATSKAIREKMSAQAIEAAEQNGIKKPVSTVVIPSPHEEILRIINTSVNKVV